MKSFTYLLGIIVGASSASAQARPPSSDRSTSEPAAVTWSVGAGYVSLWVRDVSSTTRPVDASPVSWQGRGLALVVHRDRNTAARLHHLEGTFEKAGGFVLRTPLQATSRAADERAVRAALRYEYRRYPLRDLGVTGLNVGLGAESGVVLQSDVQYFVPAIEHRKRGTDLTVALVTAAHLRRWRPFHIQFTWVNGGAVGRTTTRHSSADQPAVSAWGGGWLTDVTLRADVRISEKATLFASYFGTGRGRLASHDALASGQRRFVVGVSHDR
jgi:hypothetical protein